MMAEFHFLRPEWFYAIIPAVALYLVLRYREGRGSAWERTIDPSLLPYLLETSSGKTSRNPRFLLLVGWLVGIIALAGPVWEQTPQPVHEREDALVIVLDLTRSMYANDVKPNRLVRARRKLLDLLAERNEGVTGLVVYAGDAHLVSPLTDDAKTIAELIPAVSPSIMPAPGSNL
ncbi:MAG: Ca-activated chloride channel family protein, partial [Candidatus Azotimanducaceae bacterium]